MFRLYWEKSRLQADVWGEYWSHRRGRWREHWFRECNSSPERTLENKCWNRLGASASLHQKKWTYFLRSETSLISLNCSYCCQCRRINKEISWMHFKIKAFKWLCNIFVFLCLCRGYAWWILQYNYPKMRGGVKGRLEFLQKFIQVGRRILP